MSHVSHPSACSQYDLEIAISAPREAVWRALFEQTNEWWLPDFRILGTDSVVTFDPVAGGRGLVEDSPAGDSLLWYSIHMFQPSAFSVYLIGHLAPQWGGPATSSLQFALVEADNGCLLKVTEARHGQIDAGKVEASASGWTQLLTDGLKAFVEKA